MIQNFLSFIVQFGLIGLGLVALYLVWQSDHSRNQVFDFFSPSPLTQTSSQSTAVAMSPATSYADAVASAFTSVVAIYTSKQVKQKTHPLPNDPIFN